MSTLSVLLLVNDSEPEDAGGSIGVGCVLGRPGKERDADVDACGTQAERRDLRCAEEREKYLLEKRGEVLRRAKASKTYLKPLNRGAKRR
jgi:hypothetical protein